MTDTRSIGVLTDLVEYLKDDAVRWLDGPHPDLATVTGALAPTVAGVLGIDDDWPTGDDDLRLAVVVQLIERALADRVIDLVGPTTDVDLFEVRNRFGVLAGARMLVTTRAGVILANDRPLWASDFTGDLTGRDAALHALAKTAVLIDDIVRAYRHAEGQ